MSAFKTIANLTKANQFYQSEIERLKKANEQQLAIYKEFNRQDVLFIARLKKEIKQLKAEIKRLSEVTI